MRKRKMLRMTTILISVLTIFSLLSGMFLLVYRNYTTYHNRLMTMQKDLLINFQSKTDEILSTSAQTIASWMLEDGVIQFSTEGTIDKFNLIQAEKQLQKNAYYRDLDCILGIYRPGEDVFLTNAGVLYSWDLEKQYDFIPGAVGCIQELSKQEFVNNSYLSTELSKTGETLTLLVKRNHPANPEVDLYGFVSLNLRKVAKELSQSSDNVFFAKKDDATFFASRAENEKERFQILSEPSKFIYDLQYSVGSVTQSNTGYWVIYSLLFLLLIAAGLFGSFYLAKLLNKPIDNILRQLSDDETDIYDEEAYIRNRFVEIKAINQQLENQVNEQEKYVKQNFVRDLLYGMAHDEEASALAEQYGLSVLYGDISMAVLEEKQCKAMGGDVFSRIVALLETKIDNSIVVFSGSGQLSVIAKRMESEIFKREITQAILQISEWYGVDYISAICEGSMANPQDLSRIFGEAMHYLQSGNFGYDKLVITKENLYERDEQSYYYPLEFERNIISCVANNDFDSAMQILGNVLDKNLKEMTLGKAALVEFKFALVGTVKRVLQVLQKTETELFGEGSVLYLELSACKTPEEITEKVNEMFAAIREFAESAYVSATYVLIDEIENYIQKNFHRQDMSLLLLAEYFNLTSGYISKIFKKCRQINFKDYLSAYRIQKATEILDATPWVRVADLAQKVGYDNVNSFIRNFKKLKKVSPGEYKKQH